MIIACTKCEKRFVVPDNAIPAEGRTVQCSACSNKWKQIPIKESESPVKTRSISVKKKRTKKIKMPTPYSKDYMKEKWGVNVQDYAQKEGLTKKSSKDVEGSGFGFFSYIIIISIILLTFVGALKLAESTMITQFPFLESYINYFFETLDNFKIFILDLYR